MINDFNKFNISVYTVKNGKILFPPIGMKIGKHKLLLVVVKNNSMLQILRTLKIKISPRKCQDS